ncbi:DUF6232 family protein [Actinomadura madurae]|uniref:DUF6232 family protein n=1 Tax=Actinomadura madurae TaxID=1993 RepID=UPI0024E20E29|nr:DUF6232 family protein [Actinomadura madurae]
MSRSTRSGTSSGSRSRNGRRSSTTPSRRRCAGGWPSWGVFGLVAMLVAAAAGGGTWAGLVFLATAFLAGRILYQLWRIYTNEPRHAVVVQTTGTPIGIFTTNDEGTAHKLFHLIVAAIEDPTHARRETINITIEGDQINQVANDSSSLIGKLVGAKA